MNLDTQSLAKAKAQYQLANAWQIRGKPDLAINGYREALYHDRTYVPAALELATLLIRRNEIAAALKLLSDTLEAVPDNLLLARKISEIQAQVDAENDSSGPPTSTIECSNLPHPELTNLTENTGKTILFYTDCSGTYGAEQLGHLIMRDLHSLGYRVVCAQAYTSHSLIDERENLGIRHIWHNDDDLYNLTNPTLAATDRGDSRKILKDVQPDFVFFSDGGPLSSLNAKIETVAQGIPFVILNHCVNEDWISQSKRYASELEETMQNAQEIVAVSQQNLDILRQNFRVPPDKGRVIYNSRPDIFFAPRNQHSREKIREELSLDKDSIICLTVARMEVMKGYQYLVSAIKHLQHSSHWDRLHFVWVGTGTLEGRLQSRIAELGAEKQVHFLGYRSDVIALLEAADIFILPSQYEGMPLSVIEAMAKGLPVAATGVSGIPEALGDSGCLLTDPKADFEQLIKELSDIIEKWAKDAKLRTEVGAVGKERAQIMFSSSRMLKEYRTLIRQNIFD